jgi:RNA polymerase sigma-70 factor (ECF subfamily)
MIETSIAACDAKRAGGVHEGVETPDALLVERARAGDTRAFQALVDRYYADFLRYATRMLGNRADAEEAVQDALLRAYRALPRYEDRGKARAWMLGILVNRCRTMGARLARLRRFTGRFRREPHRTATDPHSHDTEWSQEVDRALLGLPEGLREAFLLKYVEELSYDEMAELTGAGVSALKMRVKRACERLRAELGEVRDG